MSIPNASQSLGFTYHQAWDAAKTYGVRLKRLNLVERVLERADEIGSSYLTQKQWAEEMGVSAAALGHALKQAGVQTARRKKKVNVSDDQMTNYRRVIGHIAANGGTIPDALRALGLDITPHPIRLFAKRIGFDLSHYQFAWQTHSHWLTLPGPWERRGFSTYTVPAMCQICGQISMVSLINIRTNQSRMCANCAASNKKSRIVFNPETGENFKSIRGWAHQIGHGSKYQYLRVKLINKGFVIVDGARFELVNQEQDSNDKPHVSAEVIPAVIPCHN